MKTEPDALSGAKRGLEGPRLNLLLTAAAVVYAATGLALTFVPDELVRVFGPGAPLPGVWLAQLLGAALLGLAWLNWLQRHAAMGGVLGRPVLLTNLVFVTISFWATLHTWRQESALTGLLAVAGVLGTFSVGFGARLFRAPSR